MKALNIQAPSVKLNSVSDENIEAMVNLLPDFSTGNLVHSVYVNKIMGSLPGHYSQMFGTGSAFRKVFYPGWKEHALTKHVAGDTGLNSSWWHSFSVALLCQSIDAQTSSIKKQMMSSKINKAISAKDSELRGKSYSFYSRALKSFAPFKSLLVKADMATAKDSYAQALKENVAVREIWYQGGLWQSPDWEMFNHYAKYMALGASSAEVDSLIDSLTASGLPIPTIVDKKSWRTYTTYLREHPHISHSDIDSAASSAIHETTYLSVPGGGYPSSMPEGNCYEFTANSQPGSPYRELPGHCCFTKNTEILMADGSSKAISSITRGEKVVSPDGPRTVTFVAKPLLGERTLYSLGANSPVFAGTHPFVNGANTAGAKQAQPELLAISPERLGWLAPTLLRNGIGKLEKGAQVSTRTKDSDHITAQAVSNVSEADTSDVGTILYDLNLSYDEAGPMQYWAGSGNTFYLVAPEMPVVADARSAADTIMTVMQGLLHEGIPGLDDSNQESVVALQQWLHQYGAAVFQNALSEAISEVNNTGTAQEGASIAVRVDQFIQGLNEEDATGVAVIFETLMSTIAADIESFVALGWRDFSSLGGDTVVLSVFDMALSPGTPIPENQEIRLNISYLAGSEQVCVDMWDGQGRANTRFHHFFDQLIHFSVGEGKALPELRFDGSINGVVIPSLYGSMLLPDSKSNYVQGSVPMKNTQGEVLGHLNFDLRKMPLQNAKTELVKFSRWTEQDKNKFASGLGAALVSPLINGLKARLKKKAD